MYNVMDDFRAGRQGRQAAEEQNYIQARRLIEDPLKDRDANRVDAARQANVAEYGVKAGDPTSYGQLEGIKQRGEMHPIAVKQAEATLDQTGVTTEGMRADQANTLGERERAAAVRTLDAIEASGATTPQEIAQRIPPAMLAQLGTDPKKFPQLLETLGQFPDLATGLRSIRDGLMGQEKVTGTISGYDAEGNPITIKQGSRDKPGVMEGFSPVDEAARAQAARLGEANIEATRALSNQRNRPPAGRAGAVTPQQAAAAAARATMLIDEAMGFVAEGARKGYIPSENQDAFTRAGAQLANIPLVGPALQGAMDPKAQTLRDNITGKTNALLREYTKAMGIMSTSINSNFELQNIQAIIRNADSSAEAQLEALGTVKQLLADPAFAERVLAAEGATAAAAGGAPQGSGLPPDIEDLVNQYAPGTD